jgi:hypothetical protein
MKYRRIGNASPSPGKEAGDPGHDIAGARNRVQSLLSHVGTNPMVAIAIASVALALSFGFETGRLGFHRWAIETSNPAQAVDISLQRLMRSRVTMRLRREHRLNASPNVNDETIEAELRRVREHPLYLTIKSRMTDHLQSQGYERVSIKRTQDARYPMLSLNAETTLDRFIRSYRGSFSAPNGRIATFLNEQEQLFGKSIVARRGDDRYDTSFGFLIQLLAEYPEDFEPIAGAISLVSRSPEEIEREVRGGPRD